MIEPLSLPPPPDSAAIESRFQALLISQATFAQLVALPRHTIRRWLRGQEVGWRAAWICYEGLRAIEQARGVR